MNTTRERFRDANEYPILWFFEGSNLKKSGLESNLGSDY